MTERQYIEVRARPGMRVTVKTIDGELVGTVDVPTVQDRINEQAYGHVWKRGQGWVKADTDKSAGAGEGE